MAATHTEQLKQKNVAMYVESCTFFYDIIGLHAIRVHKSLRNKIGHWQCHTRKYHLQKITPRGPTRANKNNNPKGCLLIKGIIQIALLLVIQEYSFLLSPYTQ